MLPLHGQDTAAVELSHWAGFIFNKLTKDDVFGKQAGFEVAEFFPPIFKVIEG